MKTLLFALAVTMAQSVFSADVSFSVVKSSSSEKKVLEQTFESIRKRLPDNFKTGLPATVFLKVEKLSEHKTIPENICETEASNEKKRPFIYGEYNQKTKTLTLNQAVVNVLENGPENSPEISCQHRTIYNQALATIIHELAHAFDFNDRNISSSVEFLQRAGFKKGLLKIKNKNTEAMRPADSYGERNAVEAFAVNAEYYVLDPQFPCRKPAMAQYLEAILGRVPEKSTCSPKRTVMMSTSAGPYPVSLDPSRIYRIDYLLASPGKDLSSGFGHSMFRLVLCAPEHFDAISGKMIPATPFGKKCLEDRLFHLVVSYRANVEDVTLNYRKGLFGGYPSMMFILNFGDVLDEYNRDELRAVESYPLSLSEKEKLDILNKILEDHWNYRGRYKFLTNNCAVESLDLLKNSLDRAELNDYHSLSPKGVLEDLDRLEYVSLKNGEKEVFKAKTEQLLLAYKAVFGLKERGANKEKDQLVSFVNKSSALFRKNLFTKFTEAEMNAENLHDQVATMKNRLVKASSFSVLEQHILRSKASLYRKKALELFMNGNDQKLQDLAKAAGVTFKQNVADLARPGYGVPLEDEIMTREDLEQKIASGKKVLEQIERNLKERMPEEFKELQLVNDNITLFNKRSLEERKAYREKLLLYISQVIRNMSFEDQKRQLLVRAMNEKEALDEVRELLDASLVSHQEILDIKLRKIITDLIRF